MMDLYHYSAVCKRVIDGDSVILDVDLGFKITVEKIVRLAGINTPELNSADPVDREKAAKAKEYLRKQVEGKTIYFNSKSLDIYGRSIAELYLKQGSTVSVNESIVKAGFGVVVKY